MAPNLPSAHVRHAMSRSENVLPRLLAAALLAAPSLALAQQAPPPRDRDQGPVQGQFREPPPRRGSLSDAVRRVERNTRGEVLSAERIQFDGRDMHRVKVVDDQGRVRVFMQDPSRRDSGKSRPDQPPRDDED